jgi:Leucine-rich repeat (LRR) protein
VIAEILAVNGDTTSSVSNVASFSEGRCTSLYLTTKKIHTLTEFIGNLDSLKSISISSGQLSELPNSIGKLSKLYFLSCYECVIYKLPSSFSNLHSLETVYFTRNHFTVWPEVFYSMPKLTMIDMGCNNLTNLPEQISELAKLKKLYVNDNLLKKLPESISGMSLDIVNIAGNAICDPSPGIVKWLDLHDYYKVDSKWRTYQYCSMYSSDIIKVKAFLNVNNWDDLPPDSVVIIENGNIVGIDVSAERRMQLGKSLSPTSPGHGLMLCKGMEYMKHLRSLNVSGTNITMLSSSIDTLCHLEKLDLSNNHLTTLPEEMVFFQNLKSLSLSNNQISFVSEGVGQWADTYSPGWRNEQLGTVKAFEIIERRTATLASFVSSAMSRIIQVQFNKPLLAEIEVFNVSGRFIGSLGKGRFEAGVHRFNIDYSTLQQGACLVILKSGSRVIDVKKLIWQK